MARASATPTPEPEPAEPKIVQVVAHSPVIGGDNAVEWTGGRSSIAAWGLQDDGKVVALVRNGAELVVAVAPEPEPEPIPEPELEETPATEESEEAPAEPESEG